MVNLHHFYIWWVNYITWLVRLFQHLLINWKLKPNKAAVSAICSLTLITLADRNNWKEYFRLGVIGLIFYRGKEKKWLPHLPPLWPKETNQLGLKWDGVYKRHSLNATVRLLFSLEAAEGRRGLGGGKEGLPQHHHHLQHRSISRPHLSDGGRLLCVLLPPAECSAGTSLILICLSIWPGSNASLSLSEPSIRPVQLHIHSISPVVAADGRMVEERRFHMYSH